MSEMTQEEIARIFENAPDGATHYSTLNDTFYSFSDSGSGKYWSDARKYWSTSDRIEQYKYMIPRPSSPAWSGDGNPPVGVTCWVHPHNTCWGFSSTSGHKRSILAYHGDYVWLGYEGQPLETTRVDKVDFSPIRTPEQIAAEQREAAIEKMHRIYMLGALTHCEGIVALYDAGLRFTESEQPK